MTDAQWVSIEDKQQRSDGSCRNTDGMTGRTLARTRVEAPMLTECSRHQHTHLRQPFRSIIEVLARFILGEPASIVPNRKLERLAQLERREQLRQRAIRGDHEFFERELAATQLTASDLERTRHDLIPISQWPDEDFESMFCDGSKKEEAGTGI